jgi:hypothetical protein
MFHDAWGVPKGRKNDEKMTCRKEQNGSVQNAQNLTLILRQVESGSNFVTSKPHKLSHLLYSQILKRFVCRSNRKT